MSEVRIELVTPEAVLLAEIAEPKMRRDDVALTYAMAMRSSEVVDWKKVNKAIIERWSLSALEFIKARAWKRVLPDE